MQAIQSEGSNISLTGERRISGDEDLTMAVKSFNHQLQALNKCTSLSGSRSDYCTSVDQLRNPIIEKQYQQFLDSMH